MSVHVSIGGESISTVATMKRSLPTVDQNVSIQTRTGAQHLEANATSEAFVVLHFGFVVVRSDVKSEFVLGGQHRFADWTDVLAFGGAAIAAVVGVAGLHGGGVGCGEDARIAMAALVGRRLFT